MSEYRTTIRSVDDSMEAVVWLEEVGKEDLSVVGGKGASLDKMINIGIPVPGDFDVTAQASRDNARSEITKKPLEAIIRRRNIIDNCIS